MSRMYRVTFKGTDGLPHGIEVMASGDREAIAECKRFYGETEWVLRRRRGPALEIIAESCASEETSACSDDEASA